MTEPSKIKRLNVGDKLPNENIFIDWKSVRGNYFALSGIGSKDQYGNLFVTHSIDPDSLATSSSLYFSNIIEAVQDFKLRL